MTTHEAYREYSRLMEAASKEFHKYGASYVYKMLVKEADDYFDIYEDILYCRHD